MTKSRLEAFADGIFAIAATLLILNVTVPGLAPLGEELKTDWVSYLAYVVSFATIGIIWINHNTVMHQIGRVDRTFLVLNVLFLMLIAFIPFPTRLLAQYIRTDGAEAAAIAYGVTLTLTAILFNALWRYASWGGRLLRPDADARVVEGIGRSYLLGPTSYALATVIAVKSPPVSAALFAAIAVLYVLESSVFARR